MDWAPWNENMNLFSNVYIEVHILNVKSGTNTAAFRNPIHAFFFNLGISHMYKPGAEWNATCIVLHPKETVPTDYQLLS